MSNNDCNTKRRAFHHLTKEKRAQIEILLRQKVRKAEIARLLGISRSTLYNELNRGTVEQLSSELIPYRAYYWDAGQRVYEKNRENSRPSLKLMQAYPFIKYADEMMIKKKLSPDAICGRARKEQTFTNMVCTKTLYNYIDQCLLQVRNIDLPMRVKRKSKKVNVRKNRRQYGTGIEERPETINTRTTFGHGEIDTIVGRKETSSALLCLDERMTRRRYLQKIPSRTAEAVREGIEKIRQRCGEMFPVIFRTITADNGSEFALLQEQLPDTLIYYAHPYSSFERGTNEKQNSLVRRFFPKGTDFANVSDEEVAFVENWINLLPRKILNYSSADEVFRNVLFDIAI